MKWPLIMVYSQHLNRISELDRSHFTILLGIGRKGVKRLLTSHLLAALLITRYHSRVRACGANIGAPLAMIADHQGKTRPRRTIQSCVSLSMLVPPLETRILPILLVSRLLSRQKPDFSVFNNFSTSVPGLNC